MALRTNRELYAHVLELARRPSARPLEEYLRALWALAAPLSHRDALTLDELGALLEGALAAEAAAFGPDWREERELPWQETLRLQVVDLRELAASGDLADEQRYFGLDAPGGGRWYNFDVGSYLECGVQGAFGGWTPEENDGRVVVPGKVAVIDQAGQLVAVDPQDLQEEELVLERVTWEDFERLLWAGQSYE
ncbi:MAG: hypothetical protein IPM35_13500 [Myxococcales bacterium]|nr:hypothetical protein [Myxococcales bacterium]